MDYYLTHISLRFTTDIFSGRADRQKFTASFCVHFMAFADSTKDPLTISHRPNKV
jgi:hypothetical protein